MTVPRTNYKSVHESGTTDQLTDQLDLGSNGKWAHYLRLLI